MSARDDAIEAALDQMWRCCADCAKEPVNRDAQRAEAERVVDAVEPIIRADEHECFCAAAHVEAEVRERIAQEVRDMNPGMGLAGRVIAEVAARIARGGAQ